MVNHEIDPSSREAAAADSSSEVRRIEVARTSEKVVRIVGDWAVHTFLDESGNELHSIGFPRQPLFSEEDIAASENETQLV
ncbi:hypothetical protein [Antrihabitans stalactiti]|uniref:Uncharacterized protein n=1 Tax=Antrihabitans stalactiti TaxID=2584121 RepID=A0A848KQB5_9NOCA|nr:hypothetical protein [Antrihabitans stalactiti]NMN98470.1 hypothetical protein [Antrihabitans stalactiti]